MNINKKLFIMLLFCFSINTSLKAMEEPKLKVPALIIASGFLGEGFYLTYKGLRRYLDNVFIPQMNLALSGGGPRPLPDANNLGTTLRWENYVNSELYGTHHFYDGILFQTGAGIVSMAIGAVITYKTLKK